MYSSVGKHFTDRQGIFTSYGSVLALHQSRSICLTFFALGAVTGPEAGAGLALLRENKDKHKM